MNIYDRVNQFLPGFIVLFTNLVSWMEKTIGFVDVYKSMNQKTFNRQSGNVSFAAIRIADAGRKSVVNTQGTQEINF